ncbi:MAG: prolyl oligopeptidase family serine peptidase [Planctomycetia bacterium]
MNTNTPPRFAPLPFLAHHATAMIAAAAVIVAGVAFMPGRAGAQEPAAAAAAPSTKNLVVPGEVFSVDGHTAFLFTPAEVNALPPGAPRPWILYGPTLAAYPDEAERWMHERFTEAGVAVAGIDTGESYGSPIAVAATEKLHAEMVKRGYAAKPALLGRSRGGLWASAWAIAHPDLTAGLGGIYPVYDWRTYPGVDSAAGAYGLTPADLLANVEELCPVERIDVAARAGIPVCIIHGDIDVVVPIEPNSARLKARYEALGKGDLVELIVAEGQGHNFWEGFFHCQKLVDFLIQRARAGATGGDTAAAGE